MAQFLTLQESSSQSVVDPYSTDARANLAARPQRKEKTSGNWHQRNQLPWEEHLPSGPAKRGGGEAQSLLHSELQQCSSLHPGQLPQQCFFRQYKEHTSNLPFSAWQKVVSVNVSDLVSSALDPCLVSSHWRIVLSGSTRAGRTLLALWTEMQRSFRSLLAVIKPMIKNPRFASVETTTVNVDTSAQMLRSFVLYWENLLQGPLTL